MTKCFDFVVVGGGVAGSICANTVCRLRPNATVCLISPSEYLKSVKVVKQVSEHLEELTVIEEPFGKSKVPNLTFVQDFVARLEPQEKKVVLNSGEVLSYGKLALCTGASPKVHDNSPFLLTVRDTDSAQTLNKALSKARKVIVAGNGAIALELVTKIRNVDLTWIVKHEHVGDSLLDCDVAQFLLDSHQDKNKENISVEERKRPSGLPEKEEVEIEEAQIRFPLSQPQFGHGLGPKWTINLSQRENESGDSTSLQVLYRSKLAKVIENPSGSGSEWPIHAVLSNGKEIGADLIVSCIGVLPNTTWLPKDVFEMAEDGGLLVDERMQTSVPDVYAAGDVCTLRDLNYGPQFFQVRLWSQARLMADFAAHCMAGTPEADLLDLGFELFTHITHFFGKKVILLGCYDGQRLQNEPEEDVVMYTRSDDETFVRVLLLRGRLQGAVLVGETDLEELFENLILSGIDLTQYGPELLDPEAELDHVFD